MMVQRLEIQCHVLKDRRISSSIEKSRGKALKPVKTREKQTSSLRIVKFSLSSRSSSLDRLL